MVYRITELTREKSTGNTYLLVEFWVKRVNFNNGDPPYLTNEFLMTLFPDSNPRQAIHENIRAYWERAKTNQIRGDHTSDPTKPLFRKGIRMQQRVTPQLQRDTQDNGIIKRSDVKDLVGIVRGGGS